MNIQNSASLLIVDGSRILACKYRDSGGGVFYALPGTQARENEALEAAAVRNCLETTGYTVYVRHLTALFEEEPAPGKSAPHRMLFLFRCELDEEEIKKVPTRSDLRLLGAEWLEAAELEHLPLLPEVLRQNLRQILHSKSISYIRSAF